MANPVTWFEITGEDTAKLQKFYTDVFDWKLTPPDPAMGNFSMLTAEANGIGGGLGGTLGGPARVTIYIEVDDPQAYLDKATKAGATVVMPVSVITPEVTIAMFTDPVGHITGLLKRR
jgi:predicted enzyme related to lactoylglutathione lyase